MKKNDLLHLIAQKGYNVGFGAKVHFATFDIVEKAPGWINVVGFVIGVFALIFPPLAASWISATLVIASALTLYVTFYNADKEKYAQAGVELTKAYHEIHYLYVEVKAQPEDADVGSFGKRLKDIVDSASGVSISKQIFLANEYAHIKFFWQNQIGWVNEQLNFKFCRDKVPFSVWVLIVVLCIAIVTIFVIYGLMPFVEKISSCKT